MDHPLKAIIGKFPVPIIFVAAVAGKEANPDWCLYVYTTPLVDPLIIVDPKLKIGVDEPNMAEEVVGSRMAAQ